MEFIYFVRYFLADTPFSQVKLGELGSWFGRRNKSPQAFVAACSRTFWRWQHKYCLTRRVGVAPFFQFVSANMVLFYIFNYGRISMFWLHFFLNATYQLTQSKYQCLYYCCCCNFRAPPKLQIPLN